MFQLDWQSFVVLTLITIAGSWWVRRIFKWIELMIYPHKAAKSGCQTGCGKCGSHTVPESKIDPALSLPVVNEPRH